MSSDKIRDAAESGDAEAQYELGLMYTYGGDVPKDYAEAAEWFAKASASKHIGATRELGVLYLLGEGVDADMSKAYSLLSEAAKSMDPRAMYHLGLMYEKGKGVPRNLYEAVRLLSFAANMNYEGADIDADRVDAIIEEERTEKLMNRPLGKLVISDDDVESACCHRMLDDILEGRCYFMDTYLGPALVSEDEISGLEIPLAECPFCGEAIVKIKSREE
jgi:uncharacterized protein